MKRILPFSLFLAFILLSGNIAFSQVQRTVGGTRLDLDDNAGNHIFFTNAGSSLGINAASAAPSTCALLDLASTSKGLLVPRMSALQESNVCGGAPTEGLIVYNTTTHTLDCYTGAVWNTLGLTPTPILVPELVTMRGTFNAGTSYDQNDLVSSTTANTYFFSLVAGTGTNTGNTPETSPTMWQAVRVEQLHTIRKFLTLSAPGFTSLMSIGLPGTMTAGGRIQYTVRATDGGAQIATEEGVIQWLATANSVTCTVQSTDKLHLGTTNSGCTPGFFNPGSQPGISIFDNVSFSTPAPIVVHEVYFRLSTCGGQSAPGSPVIVRLEP